MAPVIHRQPCHSKLAAQESEFLLTPLRHLHQLPVVYAALAWWRKQDRDQRVGLPSTSHL